MLKLKMTFHALTCKVKSELKCSDYPVKFRLSGCWWSQECRNRQCPLSPRVSSSCQQRSSKPNPILPEFRSLKLNPWFSLKMTRLTYLETSVKPLKAPSSKKKSLSLNSTWTHLPSNNRPLLETTSEEQGIYLKRKKSKSHLLSNHLIFLTSSQHLM